MHWRRKWQPTPVFLPGESQGWGSLVGRHLWVTQGRTQLKRLSSSSSKTIIKILNLSLLALPTMSWVYLKSCILTYFSQMISILERKCRSLSCVWPFATPWTVPHQASLSMAFSRQEYWSGLPYSSPGDLPVTGIKARSPPLQADSLPSEPPGSSILNCLQNNSYPKGTVIHSSRICPIEFTIMKEISWHSPIQ